MSVNRLPNPNRSSLLVIENAQIGITYTPVLSDAFKVVTLSNAGTIAVTLPTNATVPYPVGTELHFEWEGVGQPTISAVTPATTTIQSTAATPASPKLRIRYAACTAHKRGIDDWRVWGDIA